MKSYQKKSLSLGIAPITAGALFFALVIFALCFPARRSEAQSGVLIPSSLRDKPDANLLSLQVMNVDVFIDNQHATVRVLQIFDSHTAQTLEGKYLFALPPQASIADFAVWDGDTRIPGVMMEKRRANAIYSGIKRQQIDPGLLQQDDEHQGQSAFSAKVFPINAYGSKRVEMQYTEMLAVESLNSHFTFPLKPSSGDAQRVGEFNLHIHVLSDYPISIPDSQSAYPLRVTKSQPNEFEGEFQAQGIELKEDFSFDYKINVPESVLSWIAYRAPERISAYDLRDPAQATRNPDGYFEARAIFNQQGKASADAATQNGAQHNTNVRQPRNIILLLDTSLSMYGEKLVRAVEALDYFLHSLSPRDHFNLVLFNKETNVFSSAPLTATPENVEQALHFIKGSSLGGGTNLKKAFQKALDLTLSFPAGERSIVLISDANPTLGTTSLKSITRLFKNEEKSSSAKHTRVFAFALGSDANNSLIEELAKKTHGYFARARETEDISSTLQIFFAKVGTPNIQNLQFASSDQTNFYQVYATGANSFDGSSFAFVGRYRKPQPQTMIKITGQYGTDTFNLTRYVSLPEFEDTHPHLPRLWARARVDALLQEMNLNGEREDYIAEIIRLSQKYKFVTPYTAFLAAPRALLRPRLIQPGDPVIRVKTDPAIKAVFAVLPFGETLPLKFLPTEGVWEGRFLAPSWMPDGTYRCRLLLTDKDGNGYEEGKTFVIDSHPPRLNVRVPSQAFRAGDEIQVRVDADKDTNRLIAKLYGAQPAQLYWSSQEKVNIGRLRVPAGLAAGQYVLTVTAEDFAHNQSTAEVRIEVLGR